MIDHSVVGREYSGMSVYKQESMFDYTLDPIFVYNIPAFAIIEACKTVQVEGQRPKTSEEMKRYQG